MITFRKVREDDLELNSKIEDLNIKVFPSTETTSDLHILENYYKGASVDFIAIEDDDKFMGYTYMINFFQGSFIYYLAIEPEYQGKGLWNCPAESSAGDSRQSPHSSDHLYTSPRQ